VKMVEAAAVANCKSYPSSREQFEGMVGYLHSPERQSMSHSDLERELEIQGRELLRRLYQEHLQLRGMGEAGEPVQGADGVERTQRRTHKKGLMSIFGKVEVHRTGHGAEGVESLHPLDAELNLPEESYSFRVRQRVANEASKNSYDETVESITGTTGASVPKRQTEQWVERAAQDFDAFYEARKQRGREGGATGPVLALSVDGKGVTMRPSALREATLKQAQQRKHKLDKRLSKGKKRGAKRMATVAAVYTVARFVRTPEDVIKELAPVRDVELKRPRPEEKRVWASLEKTPEEVIREALREASYRDPRHEKTWVALVDGNKPQLKHLRELSR